MTQVYRPVRCTCGHRACSSWHVWPVADVQGVNLTQRQAVAVAALLNGMQDDPQFEHKLAGTMPDTPAVTVQYLRDVGGTADGQHDECWVPCAQFDPGAVAFAPLPADPSVLAAALHDCVDAWEALPGGRNYSPRTVESWMSTRLLPAINAARRVLHRRKPNGEQS